MQLRIWYELTVMSDPTFEISNEAAYALIFDYNPFTNRPTADNIHTVGFIEEVMSAAFARTAHEYIWANFEAKILRLEQDRYHVEENTARAMAVTATGCCNLARLMRNHVNEFLVTYPYQAGDPAWLSVVFGQILNARQVIIVELTLQGAI